MTRGPTTAINVITTNLFTQRRLTIQFGRSNWTKSCLRGLSSYQYSCQKNYNL